MDALSASNGTFCLDSSEKAGCGQLKKCVYLSPKPLLCPAMVLMGQRATPQQMCQVRSGSRLWAAADALSLVGEPVSAIRIQRSCSTALAYSPVSPSLGAPSSVCLACDLGLLTSAAPDSSRTGLSEQGVHRASARTRCSRPCWRGPVLPRCPEPGPGRATQRVWTSAPGPQWWRER